MNGETFTGSPRFLQGVKLPSESSATELCLHLEENLMPRFFQLLQRGFMVRIQVGCSVLSLLCDQLGLSSEYVEKRIKTLFLDGKPVDDINSAIIRDGSTLALSAAMPGLAGAVLRRGGYYASMRNTISHREKTEAQRLHDGTVSLKLFNILLKEIGPTLLQKGIWIRGKDLQDLIERQADELGAGCKKAIWDDKEWDLKALSQIKWADKDVFLRLQVD
jgi:hypothetical protein